MVEIGQLIFQPSNPAGYQQIDVGAVAVALTVPAGATLALIAIEKNASATVDVVARFRSDTDPTALIGMPLVTFAIYKVEIGELKQIKFISADGLTHKLNVSYYK